MLRHHVFEATEEVEKPITAIGLLDPFSRRNRARWLDVSRPCFTTNRASLLGPGMRGRSEKDLDRVANRSPRLEV